MKHREKLKNMCNQSLPEGEKGEWDRTILGEIKAENFIKLTITGATDSRSFMNPRENKYKKLHF